MAISDEDKKGYIAIGEAVISHIFDKEEISRESLMLKLEQRAEREKSEEHLADLIRGRNLLERLDEVVIPYADNVVDLEALRHVEGHEYSSGQMSTDASVDDPHKARNG